MLKAAEAPLAATENDDQLVQIMLVAGARNQLYRRLCWAAA